MFLLISFAFLSGLVTILAPCIWPLLPIVLSSSIASGGKSRPLGITLGIMLSFTAFTLVISSLIKIFNFDPNILRTIAVIVIALLGVVMIIPRLSLLFELFVSRLSTLFGNNGGVHKGFIGGFVTGLTLGVIWSPCAGPILASIATLAATGQVTFTVFAITIAYVSGVGIPLFIFAYGGQQLIFKTRFISRFTGRVQRAFGFIMIIAAILIYTHYDQVIQVKILEKFPSLDNAINGFERSEVIREKLDMLSGRDNAIKTNNNDELFNTNVKSPEIAGISNWLNSDPLTIDSLKGKVVLVDFWTYTCINCVRTLPHVTEWYEKYKGLGFVVLGIHTPEFAFEKNTKNVASAVNRFNINYPVAQDNDYKTWNAFNNEYWPAEYLIDANGVIRRVHFGEGKYEEMEMAIQKLLEEAGGRINVSVSKMPDETPVKRISPETYLGFSRMQYLYPNGRTSLGTKTFTESNDIPVNNFSFGGEWTVFSEFSQASKDATLTYRFKANKVFLVMRPMHGQAKVFISLDEGKTTQSMDVKDGILLVDTDRLYELIDITNEDLLEHTLKLTFPDGNVEVFAFTFG